MFGGRLIRAGLTVQYDKRDQDLNVPIRFLLVRLSDEVMDLFDELKIGEEDVGIDRQISEGLLNEVRGKIQVSRWRWSDKERWVLTIFVCKGKGRCG